MSARDDILELLKRAKPLSAAEVGDATGLTSMGARGHLERLERDGLTTWREAVTGRGRPRRLWTLTGAGHARFGDRHDNLTVELLDQVRRLFGEAGLERLIDDREDQQRQRYRDALAETGTDAEARIRTLAAERTREGYMAEVIARDDDSWQLIEHHCPICTAAEHCQAFCRSELQVFRDSLGPEYEIERAEHLLQDGQRCRYTIRRRGTG